MIAFVGNFLAICLRGVKILALAFEEKNQNLRGSYWEDSTVPKFIDWFKLSDVY